VGSGSVESVQRQLAGLGEREREGEGEREREREAVLDNAQSLHTFWSVSVAQNFAFNHPGAISSRINEINELHT
jgi:hypothetical protein